MQPSNPLPDCVLHHDATTTLYLLAFSLAYGLRFALPNFRPLRARTGVKERLCHVIFSRRATATSQRASAAGTITGTRR
jgi:hypothetical protein